MTFPRSLAREHAAGPLAPPWANGEEDGGGLVVRRDLHYELRRVRDGVDLVVGREPPAVPLARLLADVAEGLQGVRNMKLCSEMLLEVTVYCGKVRDQRGCQNMKYTTVEAS